MQSLGLLPEDVADQMVVEVFPENEKIIDVYFAMQTQWRAGPNGAIGLDYVALPTVFRLVGVPRKDWTDVFEGVRILEIDELIEFRKKQNG